MTEKRNDVKEAVFRALEKTGALKFGEFILASGAKSSYYIDLRVIPNFPEEFEELTDIAVDYLKECCPYIEGVVGIPHAAVPLGVMIAYKLKKPYYILRKEPKGHGLKKMIEGELKKDQKILIVDDVISSGGSKLFAINALRDKGADVNDLFVFIDRTPEGLGEFEKEHSIKVHYLVNVKDILAKME